MLVLGRVIAVGAVGNAIPRYSSASPISCRQMPGGCGGLAARRARNASHTAARAVSTWLGEKRRIYPCKLAYEPSCPFLIHRCVPLSSHDYQRRFWCWETMTQGAVDTCGTPHWNGEHFAAAFAGRTQSHLCRRLDCRPAVAVSVVPREGAHQDSTLGLARGIISEASLRQARLRGDFLPWPEGRAVSHAPVAS